MSLQLGIIGLPNVGKSTLFRAITKKQVEAQNYPFTTIEPNVGVVAVPDERLEQLSSTVGAAKTVPAVIEFVDIAGLVRGAHKGEGLGNQFLANIAEVDAVVHVVRVFDDGDIQHVDESVDPVRDIETIETELMLRDLDTLNKFIARTEKEVRSGDKTAAKRMELLKGFAAVLEDGKMAREAEPNDKDDLMLVTDVMLLTRKPMLYAYNVAETDVVSPELAPELAARPHVTVSAKIEAEVAELEPEEAKEYLVDLGLEQSGLERLIVQGYSLLGLQTYFTAGEKEARAWTIPVGATAPQAAGVIHSDFERGFIAADVVNWEDLVSAGSWAKAREAGKVRGEGKEYVMQNGDTVLFKFNV